MTLLAHGLSVGAAILALGMLNTSTQGAGIAEACNCGCVGYSELISQIDTAPPAAFARLDQCGGACAIAWSHCENDWAIGHGALPPALALLLDDFLSGQAISDPATMERFWDDGMVFTGPDGQRLDKSAMIRNPHRSDLPGSSDGSSQRRAVDLVLQDFGSTAIVSFRLVTEHGDRIISEYLNTGVFRQTDQSWRAVTWQVSRSGAD